VKKNICRRTHLFATKPLAEKQHIVQHTLAELYLQYASIENASSFVSRSLEDALIKILQIPKSGPIANARAKREGLFYKMNTFLNAGRSLLKSYQDKKADPVHHIIFEHLPTAIKASFEALEIERKQLDQHDIQETALAKKGSQKNPNFIHIGNMILSKLNPMSRRG
jgi:hypothetical protein